MPDAQIVVSLPISDRRTSFEFYRAALDLDPIGEPAADGVPEPLQFALNEGARLMLIPTGGFGWVIGEHEVAPSGQSECLLGFSTRSEAAVDDAVERARRAGATVVTAPAKQPWGYEGSFADPDGHLWMISAEPMPG